MLIECPKDRLSSGIDDGCCQGERCVFHSLKSYLIKPQSQQ